MTEEKNTDRPTSVTHQTELARDLSCFDITMIGVGAMIGAGIFVLTGIAAGAAGPALILSFVLNGVVTIFTAMVYAELGSAIPEAGGGYLWVKEGLPGSHAFLAGWMSWFAHAVAGSLYALGFSAYCQLLLHGFGMSLFGLESEVVHKLLGATVAMLFLSINYRGASETGLAGNIVTIAKLVVLAIFVGSGLFRVWQHPEFLGKFTPFAPQGLTGVFSAMGLTFIAFEGYEIIVQAGEEVKNPRRNIPRAVFWSIAIVVPIYILVAFVALGAVEPESAQATWQWLGMHAEVGLAEAARQFMPLGTTLLLLGGLLSTMSALNATTFSSTRVSFAMGRDRNLPDAFGTIHPIRRTPVVALLGSGAIIVLMAVAVPIEHVAAAADIMFLLLFLQVNIAVMTIRKKYGDKLNYGYIMPFFPIVPIIGIVTKLFLALFMFHYSPLAWYITLGWLAVGFALYAWYAKPREREKVTTPVLVGEMLPRKKERFRILVPIANPATARPLLAFAARVAQVEKGEVIVLHTVTVPYQLPIGAGRRLAHRARPIIDDVMQFLDRKKVPSSALVRLSHHNVWQSIIDTIEEYRVDFVVMGWRGHSSDPTAQVGHNLDRVLKKANCNAVIIQNPFEGFVRRVLVPIALPSQGELMFQVAGLLAWRGGHIDLLHVTAPGSSASDQIVEALRNIKESGKATLNGDERIKVSVRCVEAANAVEEIVRQASHYETVVLGGAREGWLSRQILGTRPQQIADRVDCPIVLVSRKTAPLKFGVQTFIDFFRELEATTAEETAAKPASEEERDAAAESHEPQPKNEN
jgi:amino acid transporter/nucleotide-binding universal stress UspA family protein